MNSRPGALALAKVIAPRVVVRQLVEGNRGAFDKGCTKAPQEPRGSPTGIGKLTDLEQQVPFCGGPLTDGRGSSASASAMQSESNG